MMLLVPGQAVEAEAESPIRYGTTVHTCWAPATLVSTDGETSIIRFRGELMDCTTNFEWPTSKLRPEPPASLTELGGRSLAPGGMVDLYRLGHFFLGLVLQASPSCAMGGEAFDRYDIILDATTEVLYGVPPTRLRLSNVLTSNTPSPHCWAPTPRPGVLSKLMFFPGTTTPRTDSARPLPFNKLKGLHSQRVPPAVVKVPPYLTGPVDWDLELPVYEARVGKLLPTSPGEAAAKPMVPTSNLALIISLLQDRAKSLRKQQSVHCCVSLNELESVATHLGLSAEATDTLKNVTFHQAGPVTGKRKLEVSSNAEMAVSGDGGAAEGHEVQKAGSTMQRLA